MATLQEISAEDFNAFKKNLIISKEYYSLKEEEQKTYEANYKARFFKEVNALINQIKDDENIDNKSAGQILLGEIRRVHENGNFFMDSSGNVDRDKFKQVRETIVYDVESGKYDNLIQKNQKEEVVKVNEIENKKIDFNNPEEKKEYFNKIFDEYSKLNTFDERLKFFNENIFDINNLEKNQQMQILNAYEKSTLFMQFLDNEIVDGMSEEEISAKKIEKAKELEIQERDIPEYEKLYEYILNGDVENALKSAEKIGLSEKRLDEIKTQINENLIKDKNAIDEVNKFENIISSSFENTEQENDLDVFLEDDSVESKNVSNEILKNDEMENDLDFLLEDENIEIKNDFNELSEDEDIAFLLDAELEPKNEQPIDMQQGDIAITEEMKEKITSFGLNKDDMQEIPQERALVTVPERGNIFAMAMEKIAQAREFISRKITEGRKQISYFFTNRSNAQNKTVIKDLTNNMDKLIVSEEEQKRNRIENEKNQKEQKARSSSILQVETVSSQENQK